MFVFEITAAIAILAFFIRKYPLFKSQLVICFHTFYHIFYLRPVGSNVLDSGSASFTRNQGKIFYSSPPVGNGMRNNIVPPFGGTDTQPNMFVGFLLHTDTFDGRVQDDTVEVIYKQQIASAADMQRQTLLKILVP